MATSFSGGRSRRGPWASTDKLKTRLKETIHKAFSHRNYGSTFVVLGYNSTYFSNKIQKGKNMLLRGTSDQYAGVPRR